MTPELTIDAPAKLNLVLAVGARRDDGYHDLVSALQAIDLCDTLTVRVRPASSASVRVDAGALEGGDTLVTHAVQLLLAALARDDVAVHVTIDKRIPAGAGLGGGSSDAAAALLALDALLDAQLGRRRLAGLGAHVGSDVPFFLAESGSAIVRGRGEVVHALDPLPPQSWVVVWPGVASSTEAVYARFDELGGGRHELPTDGDVLARARGRLFENDLAAAAASTCAPLAELAAAFAGAQLTPLVAGSGSAVAVPCADADEQARALEIAHGHGAALAARASARGGATVAPQPGAAGSGPDALG